MVRVGQHGHAVFGCGGSVVLLLLTMSPGAHDSICDASVWVTDVAAAARDNSSACMGLAFGA